MSFFSVGLSALSSAQIGLATTGHNISNVNTEGFHRQGIVQATGIPLGTGSGFIGQGVEVTTVKRLYSQFLEAQLTRAQTQGAQLETYLGEIRQIDNMIADASVGLSPALQNFFKATADVAASPQSVSSRQALISSSGALVSRFQTLAQRFNEIGDGINSQIVESVSLINSYAKQIAVLNEQIILQSGADGHAANDLLDQRENLVAQLSLQVGTTVIKQGDGSLNIFIGNGQPLVVGQQLFTLTTMPSPEDQQRTEVAYRYGSVNTLLNSSSLTGGKLGGLLDFRASALDPSENALGRITLGLAQYFNDQHALGQDLAGNPGGDFFKIPPITVQTNTNNGGTGVISATLANVQNLTTSDYRLAYNGANYLLTRLSDSTQTIITPAQMAAGYTLDGITYRLSSGVPNVNDSFLIQPTQYAARDIALSSTLNTTTVAAAAPFSTIVALANTGSGKISTGTVNSPSDKVTLTFTSPATFDVVDSTTGAILATGAGYAAGSSISYNGWTIPLAGVPVAGDVLVVDGMVAKRIVTSAGSSLAMGEVSFNPSVTLSFTSPTAFDVVDNKSGATLAAGVSFSGAKNWWTERISGTPAAGDVFTLDMTIASKTSSGVGSTAIARNLRDTVTLTFTSATTYNLVDQTTGTTLLVGTYNPAASNSISYNGWSVQLTGAPEVNDIFTIVPNTNGTSDNRNALLLGKLQQLNTMMGGTANFQSAYAQLVSEVGSKTSEIDVTSKAQQSLISQSKSSQQALSGVNLDEEAANLMRYQQAYQAAGKMLQISTTLFDTLLSIGR